MSDISNLFLPTKLGAITVNNRIFMAPLTRSRASDEGVPSELAIEYYAQRAGAGLIVTEATQIHPMGKGYDKTPGLHNEKQASAWKKIVDAVHEKGGKIVLQLWHVGRISHSSLLPNNSSPIAPSSISADAQTFANGEFVSTSMPRAIESEEFPEIIQQFVDAAKLAKSVGFDGVEVHAANGYLLEQFIMDGTNQRNDEYGGSPANRARFPLEVVDAVCDIWGPSRVGVRLSPTSTFNDMADSNRLDTYSELYKSLDTRNLAYLHVVEQFPGAEVTEEDKTILNDLRKLWTGAFIANGGYLAQNASEAIKSIHATAITFGRPYIANPDLPERFKHNYPLEEPDPDTMYGGEAGGYVDYRPYGR